MLDLRQTSLLNSAKLGRHVDTFNDAQGSLVKVDEVTVVLILQAMTHCYSSYNAPQSSASHLLQYPLPLNQEQQQ